LPCPRIIQLCDAYYCIFNDKIIDIYKYNSQSREKEERRNKKFQKL